MPLEHYPDDTWSTGVRGLLILISPCDCALRVTLQPYASV
jgi:hypothetical protein